MHTAIGRATQRTVSSSSMMVRLIQPVASLLLRNLDLMPGQSSLACVVSAGRRIRQEDTPNDVSGIVACLCTPRTFRAPCMPCTSLLVS